MKIGLISDLHLDCHKNYKQILEDIAWCYRDVGILILAGDIAEARSLEWEYCYKYLCDEGMTIVAVNGNHEHYRTSREYIENASNDLVSKFPNLHILNNELKTVAGIKFFGGTMWFREVRNDMWLKKGMNDFSQIPEFEKWVYLENADFTEKLQELEPGDVDVVVTHHVPSSSCIAVKYLNSPLNRFFICDQVDEIERLQLKYFCSGHVHNKVDFNIGSTRVLINPYGYSFERPKVAPCIFDV
jgi:predicted phosphodiesterase